MNPRFMPLAARTAVAHTLTYILADAIASSFLDCQAAYAQPCSGIRPFNSPWLMAGPLFQPLRGVIFASAFYPCGTTLFGRRNGWIPMTWILVAFGILSAFAPAAGSIEGLVHTTTPILKQLAGWLEIVPQAVLLFGLLCFRVNHPENGWLNWTLSISFFVAVALFAADLALRRGR